MKKEKKIKKENKVYKFTPELRELWEVALALNEARKIVAKPQGLFKKRIDVKGLIEASRLYAQTRAQFWNAVSERYPELKGKSLRASLSGITIIED